LNFSLMSFRHLFPKISDSSCACVWLIFVCVRCAMCDVRCVMCDDEINIEN